MANSLKFDVEFTAEQIKEVLSTDPKYVVVSGSYKYDPALGKNVWNMEVFAEGYDENGASLIKVGGCPRPCYIRTPVESKY